MTQIEEGDQVTICVVAVSNLAEILSDGSSFSLEFVVTGITASKPFEHDLLSPVLIIITYVIICNIVLD